MSWCRRIVALGIAVGMGVPACASLLGIEDPVLDNADASGDARADAPKPCSGALECDDGDWCNGQETCVEGTCRAGVPPGDFPVCMSNSCPEDYYAGAIQYSDGCGAAPYCVNQWLCKPACGPKVVICNCDPNQPPMGPQCLCPRGYFPSGTTDVSCILCAGVNPSKSIVCARPPG